MPCGGNKLANEETKNIFCKHPSHWHQLDIIQLSNGIYFLQIENKEGVVSKKFVKE
jgi:hypothetical protein